MIRRASSLFVVAAFMVACIGKDPTNPGEPVGTFHVTAKLTQTSCGQPPNPWEFDVRLNHDGSVLYWIQGSLPISGQVDASARAKLTTSVTSELRHADEVKKTPSCSVERSDALSVALSTAASTPAVDPGDVHSFSGVMTYTFAPTQDSDCNDQIMANGGGYDALPCTVTYEVAGTMTKSASN